jgi:hypothetical protein
MAQVEECLSSKHEVLTSKSSTKKKYITFITLKKNLRYPHMLLFSTEKPRKHCKRDVSIRYSCIASSFSGDFHHTYPLTPVPYMSSPTPDKAFLFSLFMVELPARQV